MSAPTNASEYGDDLPPDEEVIEEMRELLNRVLPGLAVEEASLQVTFADGTEKSWEVLP